MKQLIQILLLLAPILLFGQADYHVRKGNQLYENGSFSEAEEEYNKALLEDKKNFEGTFNLGDSYFRQEKYEEAAVQFKKIAEESNDPNTRSWANHNLGNSLIAGQKLDEAIDAYKDALRANPGNEAARYNLAYAQKLKNQQQQQEEQNQDNKDKDEKKEENKNEKDQENKDKNEEQDKKDDEQEKQEDQKDQKDKGDENEEQQKEPQPQGLSKEDAQRLLEAQKNQEQQTQDRLKKQKAKGQKVKIDKDW